MERKPEDDGSQTEDRLPASEDKIAAEAVEGSGDGEQKNKSEAPSDAATSDLSDSVDGEENGKSDASEGQSEPSSDSPPPLSLPDTMPQDAKSKLNLIEKLHKEFARNASKSELPHDRLAEFDADLALETGTSDARFEPLSTGSTSDTNSEVEVSAALHRHDQNARTPYERCLRAILAEMKWPGEERHIMQAMPHFRKFNDLSTFRGTVHHLGFLTRTVKIKGNLLPNRLPCLIIDDERLPSVALKLSSNGKLLVYDGATGRVREADYLERSFKLCVFEKPDTSIYEGRNRKISWFYDGFRKFGGKLLTVICLTFIANLLALATPIFTMNVYNFVIGSKSYDTLKLFLAAMVLTLALELYLRLIRSRLIAYVGARFNTQLLIEGFKRILGLPINMTESASISQQIVRLRQFENVQTFFTGHLVSAVLDLPFTIVFVIAISLIHPLLAIIPLGLAVAFAILGAISMPITRRNVLNTGRARHLHQNLLIETVNKRESIRQLRGEEVWIKRWNELGSVFGHRRFDAQFFDTVMHTLAQALVMVAGVLTLWVGSILVMHNELSIGALIAVMMFVWRVLSPIQTAFLSMNRIGQFAETARQADILMSLPLERKDTKAPTLRRNYEGNIIFQGVSFRYGSTGDPVFRGLTVRINAGEVVAITGDAASGKSSFLKLVLGLYKPQTGNVFIDRLNLQQLDIEEVRTTVGYVAQRQDYFYGTLAQNIRLASPSATDQEIEEALADTGIWLPHRQFPDGIETRLTGKKLAELPNALKQSISLARAFVKKSNIYLLDSPTDYMGSFEKTALFDKIENLRGNATVVVATDNDELIAKADRVLFLKGGIIAFNDTPDVFLRAKAMKTAQTA
ncbi:MAG: ABC transporter transmembrane domain-containing protein [Pseudomonadota bacterium]